MHTLNNAVKNSRYTWGTLAFSVLLILLLCLQDFSQIKARVNLVVVPVTVRDAKGQFVTGLTQDDFAIFEDGKKQDISNFSIDPQPLCAAIVVDTGVGGTALRREAPLFIDITSGFSAFDEMTSFRYDHIVEQLSGFTSDPIAIEKSLGIVEQIAAHNHPPDKGGGSWPQIGPNGIPVINAPAVPSFGGSSRLLNDAVFEAAKALEPQPETRRKIILLVSDGHVSAQTNLHTQDQAMHELVVHSIQLYGVLTDFSLIPSRYNAMTAYAEATGGDIYSGSRTRSMESAFARITEEARNQYVLGYVSNNEVSPGTALYRSIEVKAKNPKLKLTFRKGYEQHSLEGSGN